MGINGYILLNDTIDPMRSNSSRNLFSQNVEKIMTSTMIAVTTVCPIVFPLCQTNTVLRLKKKITIRDCLKRKFKTYN